MEWGGKEDKWVLGREREEGSRWDPDATLTLELESAFALFNDDDGSDGEG